MYVIGIQGRIITPYSMNDTQIKQGNVEWDKDAHKKRRFSLFILIPILIKQNQM